MKGNVLFGVLCILAAAVTTCSSGKDRTQSQAPEFVLTYAENQAKDYPTTQGAYKFAKLVRERAGGRIGIQISTETVLGNKKTVIEQLQLGGVDFAHVSLSPLTEFIPKLNILQMLYLYTGREHMQGVLEGPIGDSFMNPFDGSNLVALSWYDADTRSFYNTDRPIEALEDMRGLNTHVQESELMVDTIEALGAASVPTAFGDVYSGLQTGKIDGAENNWPSYESTRHYEVAKYSTLDEHTGVPELQLTVQPTWDKLSPEYQDIVRECAQESAQYEHQLWVAREKVSEGVIRKTGYIVIELSPEKKARFQEAAAPIYERYCSEYMDIIDAIMGAEGDGE